MNRHSTLFIIMFSLAVLPFEDGWCIASSPAEATYESYLRGDKKQQQACIESLVALSDEGVPYLDKLLKNKENNAWSGGGVSADYLIDAFVRIGTDKAADVLMGGALRYKSRIGYPAMAPVWTSALAKMGKKGLDRLLILSKQTETYREPWFAPEFRARKFIWFPKKQSRPTEIALAARGAIARITDPVALQTGGTLIDSPEMQHSVLLALTSTKTAGYEAKALRIWEEKHDSSALKYLLVVNREEYLPILQEKLKMLDDEVARLVRDLADLRARKVRDFVADDSVIDLVFKLGGDSVANGTLQRYIESRLWYRSEDRSEGDSTAGVAVMALGLSRAPDARPTLLVLLKDSTPLDVYPGASFGQYRLDGSGRGSGVPMFIVAAKALQELGDPTVIPEIEKLDAVNDPLFKRCFEEVLSSLRVQAERTHRENIKDGEPSVGGDGKSAPQP